MSEYLKYVEVLLKKSAEAHASDDAMRFSQAACNAANTLVALGNVKNAGVLA